MNRGHLVRRFFTSLRPGKPPIEDEAWAAQVLLPGELALFARLPDHDRRHALQVARRTEHDLGSRSEPRWIAAAMLHDVGKHDAGLSVPGRAIATMTAAVAGPARVDEWQHRRGARRRVASYVCHGEIGADEIRAAGGREEAARWSAAHHHPDTWSALPIPPDVVRVLDAADHHT